MGGGGGGGGEGRGYSVLQTHISIYHSSLCKLSLDLILKLSIRYSDLLDGYYVHYIIA